MQEIATSCPCSTILSEVSSDIVKCRRLSLSDMALALSDLLAAIGLEFSRSDAPQMPDGALQWLGEITQAPHLILDQGVGEGWNVWTSGGGWIPLEGLDIERWSVDVMEGKHLIICERDTMDDISIEQINGCELLLWSPQKYAEFVGRAVLSGKVSINATNMQQGSLESTAENEVSNVVGELQKGLPLPPSGLELSLSPTVDVQALMAERGRSGLSLRPIQLEAALWVIESDLIGPEQQRETYRWWIIEEPISGQCTSSTEQEFLRRVPQLEVMPAENMLDENNIRTRLANLLDERRAEEISSDDSGTMTSGGLLRWWRIDSDSAQIIRRKLLIPAWIGNLPIDGIRIVHGLSGIEYPSES